MKIQVKDFDELEELAKKPFEECAALISADFSDDSVLSLENKPQYFYHVALSQYILEEKEDFMGSQLLKVVFIKEQAEEIAKFVKQHIDQIDVLICQSCPFADTSFSVAVAAAAEDYLLHDDGEKFRQNTSFDRAVYDMVDAALTGGEALMPDTEIEEDNFCTYQVSVEEVDINMNV